MCEQEEGRRGWYVHHIISSRLDEQRNVRVRCYGETSGETQDIPYFVTRGQLLSMTFLDEGSWLKLLQGVEPIHQGTLRVNDIFRVASPLLSGFDGFDVERFYCDMESTNAIGDVLQRVFIYSENYDLAKRACHMRRDKRNVRRLWIFGFAFLALSRVFATPIYTLTESRLI